MDKYTELLKRIDEEIENAKKMIPVMAMGMLVIRKIILYLK